MKSMNPEHEEKRYESTRIGLNRTALKRAFADNLFYVLGRFPAVASKHDKYLALAYTVRDRLLHHWINSAQHYLESNSRTVCYLSAEFMLGPHLSNNLVNLGIYEEVKKAIEELGLDLEDLLEQEEEPGLGNGGLGRLAACYLDSFATLQIPSIGYGIRYEFGIFDQIIRDGWQIEMTDKWLRFGNPWEIPHPEIAFEVKLGGHTEAYRDDMGRYRVRWVPERVVKGSAYDTPIAGYRVHTANFLRLWQAQACESFDFQAFNIGDYYGAVDEKVYSENITKVLYPNDEPNAGKELRLQQQYFFVSCTLQDLIRIHRQKEARLDSFHHKFAIQLNDTHPAIAVAELMRLLVDEHNMGWDQAWHITENTFGYTNHTLLSEALEKWPVDLFQRLFPRHLEIIYEINHRFLEHLRIRFPGDHERLARMSIIDETGDRSLRMANLACIGSHAINGVSELHTNLLRNEILPDFHQLWPERFSNKTNGVTPRRFIALSNPRLAQLLDRALGKGWLKNLEQLEALETVADDGEFHQAWRQVKRQNKNLLAKRILERTGITVDPDSMFDIQVKRIHEYKRQHLNILHVITLYRRIIRGQAGDIPSRTCIFAGKAAPGYFMAKLIIKLINSVADVVNNDPAVSDRLKVVFLPDFNVKNAQRIYPAADLSEQISTAGKEASGTGNMKLSMNGALTIGTLDGANIEIRQEVGADNFFLFGLSTDQVKETKASGYRPRNFCDDNPPLMEALDLIASGFFSHGDSQLFTPLINDLLNHDEYMVLADYDAYVACQDEVSRAYHDQHRWTHMSIMNVAHMGKFSSDRAIREYCEEIWKAKPVPVPLRKTSSPN